jgi:hypothetical protein
LPTFKNGKIEPISKCAYDISNLELTKVNKIQVFFLVIYIKLSNVNMEVERTKLSKKLVGHQFNLEDQYVTTLEP